MPHQRVPTDVDYQRLLALRTGLRRFQHWSEEQAQRSGLTSGQHQLLLAIRGHVGSQAPSVGDIADALLLRQHSATELIDRASLAGLVVRRDDPTDARMVRLALTPLGRRRLASLSILHMEELKRLGRQIAPLIGALDFLENEDAPVPQM